MPLLSRRSRRIDRVLHGVDVDAESLYEAVAIALAQFRKNHINPLSSGPMTEFTVAVYRNPVKHKIKLGQVTRRAEHSTRDGPAGITKRQRVRRFIARNYRNQI
jgi:hypothetical protein